MTNVYPRKKTMPVLIGVSQRVTTVTEYVERRDALDQRWAAFLTFCGLIPIFIPNHPPTVRLLLEEVPLNGFLLTGGNNLVVLGGDAPERDEAELLLLEYAITNGKPLLGVCRGMQLIQHFFGAQLEQVSDHVTAGHRILGIGSERTVNSYHLYGARTSPLGLNATARAEDGIVEAVQHVSFPLKGIMWHPERCDPFDEMDRNMFWNFFGSRVSLKYLKGAG